ncbi:MAG: hypothetical protein ACPG32_15760 [Akkermansiaceae bacterium]
MTTTTQTAQIGKTTYSIIAQGYEEDTFVYTLKKGKTEKSLMNILGDWFLVSNNSRTSLPKYVTPIFKNVLSAA